MPFANSRTQPQPSSSTLSAAVGQVISCKRSGSLLNSRHPSSSPVLSSEPRALLLRRILLSLERRLLLPPAMTPARLLLRLQLAMAPHSSVLELGRLSVPNLTHPL